ncbi:uncharacterized protein LOC128986861 [Macrosteles quadrilineatus]|uniref:uncharacterized protein LOC128986861 n=1 Tax=Macrosteles quadrilineatus TaxID=74068 RepID=UPI0023E0D786|nr:uncharacterized protein LOC128986861 [Macrosteles quadrilineatus]
MLGKGVEVRWACNFSQYFCLLLFLVQIQCQVIRKSVELPVKDYLSAPQRNRDGKDHIYAQGSYIDGFRNFEVLSPHTPASALMFASLAKSGNSPTLLPLSSPINDPVTALFKPTVSTVNPPDLNKRTDKAIDSSFSRKKSTSIDLLEDGLNKATKGYSFSYTEPLSDNGKEASVQEASQEFIPVYSTPLPLLYFNNGDAVRYSDKLSSISPLDYGGIEGRNIDSSSGFNPYPVPTPSQYNGPRYEEDFRNTAQRPYSTPTYGQNDQSNEYYDYLSREKNYEILTSSNEAIPLNKEKSGREYYNYSSREIPYDIPSSSNEAIPGTRGKSVPKHSNENPQEVRKYNNPEQGNYNSQPRQNYNTNQAPYVPPTIGVIGWKSNTDHETTWKPTKALMNMADHHIKEDMKNKGNSYISTTPIPQTNEAVNGNKGQGNYEETQEAEEEEEGEEEEEEEDEDGEDEEEEEETEGEEDEEEEEEPESGPEEENNNADSPPSKYPYSAERPNNPSSYQHENGPHTGHPARYENSAETYRDPPSYPPQSYQQSGEYYEEPSLRPPYEYDNSSPSSREPPTQSHPDYENSVENYSPSPKYPPKYENSAEYPERPVQPSSSYDKSREYYNSRESPNEQSNNSPRPYTEELPYQSAEYSYDGQPLPPGPPYNPPSYAHDPRSKIGYLPPPSSYQPVSFPIDLGVRQTWTPIIPIARSANKEEIKNVPEYKSSNGRWLLNGGPIMKNNLAETNSELPSWEEFGKDKRSNNVGGTQKKVKNLHDDRNNSRENLVKREKQENKTHKNHQDGKKSNEDLSKERNNSEESVNERNNFKTSREVSDPDYNPPPPPRDLDEDRIRNHVSDREKPRKVPTRLRYPGGGLWAKPPPESGIDLGFVPQKVYTQTRKHNVVKHLPREAALQAASTAEEVINAPRLREVVSHKKVQEVYEEEGYEDSGYDHGGYKKHGASKTDTDKYNSGEHHPPVTEKDPSEVSPEEAYEEHLRHLEEVPEDSKGDPAGEGSAKQLVKANENPKVKGSWKQQKTTTNERSLAFLDEEGKGGILTEKHPTRVEGVEGKYLDVNGKRVPIVKELSDPVKFINHGEAVSFQRHSPTNVRTDEEKKVAYRKLADTNGGYLVSTPPPGYISKEYMPSRDDSSSSEFYAPKDNFKTAHKHRNINTGSSHDYIESSTALPQLSSYTSKNNRFSYMIKPETSEDNTNFSHLTKNKYGESFETPNPTQKHTGDFLINVSNEYIKEPEVKHFVSSHVPEKYSARFASSQNADLVLPRSQSYLNPEQSYNLSHEPGSQSKERKSRDLTAVGIDGTESDIFNTEFTHPTAALRAIEERMSSISMGSFDRPVRSRSRSSEVGAARKYKEIVRSPSETQEEAGDDKKDDINVRLTDEDVNIRHPFLPRDESGDSKIDYVKIRKDYDSTTAPPLRKYIVEDIELAPVTEQPITTTTHKVTTVSPKTTTEYVPEDPALTLKRLKSNPFLSSIFPGQENQEESTLLYINVQSTTTPKITTYRAKTTTEEVTVKETPEDTLHRLQSNPFLSSLISSKEEGHRNERKLQSQLRRGSRISPIVVLPEEPDMKSDSVKHVEQLTLAHYSSSNHGLMYQQVPRRTQQRISNLARHLNSDGVDAMHIVVRRSADSASLPTEKINVAASGTTTEIPVDTEKYPYYYSPASVVFPKYSPLRYATSPKDIPKKTEGGMEFYELRDKSVRCEEPTPPKNVVPKRGKDGEWNKSPQPEKQRMGKLGDQIDCLKAKYFGEDPLDNPFFKETDVGVPDFTTQSPDDSFGFHSDIKQNIKSLPENNGDSFRSSSSNRGTALTSNKFAKKDHANEKLEMKENLFKKSASKDRSKNFKFSFNKNRPFHETEHQESRTQNTFSLPEKEKKHKKLEENSEVLKNGTEHTRDGDQPRKTTIPPLSEIHSGSSGPIRLHPPKNVIISFRSKGTSNHPRIKVIHGTASLYNVNVNVVPMSSVGYLKTHPPVHIRVEDLSGDNTPYLPDTFSELDPISSAASQIAKQNKVPTTVTFLKMNPEGRLIHQHIRTFVPVPKTTIKNTPEVPKSEKLTTLWDLPLRDERKSETKFRVKRNHENDKYINSKESLELKKILLQKYAEILAKEKEETNKPTGEKESVKNVNINTTPIPISTSRNTEGFAQGNRPQYSSRYRATGPDPMHQSPSTKIRISNSENTQEARHTFPSRKPKIRFPKLTMTSRTAGEGNRSKLYNLPEPITVRLITTTTTTTTEPPPSTTTRMYKPKVVYKKEYGKPIEKVVDMFAVLKRQPSSTEQSTTTTSTEHLPIYSEEPSNSGRSFKPKRLQQFEHRTITKEEVIRRTYSPESRSDKVRTYDSIYDHPDLRGPVSRISRDIEEENFQEMLVYMVNPTTGVGEWAVMPIPAKAVSRMDDVFKPHRERVEHSKARSQDKPRSRTNRENSDLWVDTGEARVQESSAEIDLEMSTSTPRRAKSKTRRKQIRRPGNKKYLDSSELRNNPTRTSEMVTTDNTTPTSTTSSSTMDPRIIVEPHKRKYFYAKI